MSIKKLNRYTITLVIFLAMFLLSSYPIWAYNWPIWPFAGPHRITGTLGEWRSHGLHKGVDIGCAPYTEVYAIDQGTAYWIGSGYDAGIRIQNKKYIHLTGRIPDGTDGTYVEAGELIGLVAPSLEPHIHLEENAGAANPLKNLSNFYDGSSPTVSKIEVVKQGSGASFPTSAKGLPIVWGEVDIKATAKDSMSLGSPTVAPYIIWFEIRDESGNMIIPLHYRIRFDTGFGNRSYVYASESNKSYYIYWVTNSPTQNLCWDTKGLAFGKYKIRVVAEDISGNRASNEITVIVDVNWPNPGNDNPDESYDVSDANYPSYETPTGPPELVILDHGFQASMFGLADELRVPAIAQTVNDPDPLAIEDYPTLVIPTGGLYGLENSEFFRTSLSTYVENGGTLICFTQQHGYEFSALPGGEVSGYGWLEDMSCHSKAVQIDEYHQILSGQTEPILDVNVDGYFTSYPADSMVLLRRTKNGQPTMIMYPFGDGTVIATTAYTDWGYGHAQVTESGISLVRDMIAWAREPVELPEYRPGESVDLTINIKNSTETMASSVRLLTLDPNREVTEQRDITLPVAPGGTATVPFSHAASPPLGIWWAAYALLDEQGAEIQPLIMAARFVVSDLPETVESPKLSFSVQSDAESYAKGSNAVFTIIAWNDGQTDQTVNCRHFFPHHYWQTGDTQYGGDWANEDLNLTETLVVPAGSQASFVHVLNVSTTDRLWAYFYDELGSQIGMASRGIRTFSPSINVSVEPDKVNYIETETVNMSLSLENPTEGDFTGSLKIQILDSDNRLVQENYLDVTVAALQSHNIIEAIYLPSVPNLVGGSYVARTEVYDQYGKAVGSDSASFAVVAPRLKLTTDLPDALIPNSILLFNFLVTNIGLVDVDSGNLSIIFKAPDGATLFSDSQNFAVAVAKSSNISFAVPLGSVILGTYAIDYTLSYADTVVQGRISLRNSSMLQVMLDKPFYRVRDDMTLIVVLINDGNTNQELSVTFDIPDLGYSQTQTTSLDPGSSTSLAFSTSIPGTTTAGQYEASVTVELASGNTIRKLYRFLVPISSLELALVQSDLPLTAGQELDISVSNTGGIDTQFDYSLSLKDSKLFVLYEDFSNISTPAGASQNITFAIPDDAASGRYQLEITGTDISASESKHLIRGLEIVGLEADVNCYTSEDLYHATLSVEGTSDISNISEDIASAVLRAQVVKRSFDPKGNVPISIAEGEQNWWGSGYGNNQQPPRMATDGAGGAIIVWTDGRNGAEMEDIYAQRMAASGAVQWETDGLPICTTSGSQREPGIVSDSSGGGIIVWKDYRNGTDYDIYAQKVSSEGELLWSTDGIPICVIQGTQADPSIVSDGEGGAIIGWVDNRTVPSMIYAQRVGTDGLAKWDLNGVQVSTQRSTLYPNVRNMSMSSDGFGGALIAWRGHPRPGRPECWDVYAQRISPNGEILWPLEAVDVCFAEYCQWTTLVVPDGSGGGIIAWSDHRFPEPYGDYDIYAQRVDADGNVMWMQHGIPVDVRDGWAQLLSMLSDEEGGAVILWQLGVDMDSGQRDYEICAQRVDPEGQLVWGEDGIVPSRTTAGSQYWPAAVNDGFGNLIVTWHDTRNVDRDIYAQKIDGYGNLLWPDDIPISRFEGTQQKRAFIVSDSSGGAIIAWQDDRSGTDNIYAQRIFANGSLQGDEVIWQEELPLDLASGQSISLLHSIGVLGQSGKFYLTSDLISSLGQTIAADDYAFYVFEGDLALKFTADKDIYRKGEMVEIVGDVTNLSDFPRSGITLTFRKDGTPIYNESFDMNAGGVHPFNISITSDETFFLEGLVDATSVLQQIKVVEPQLNASLLAPDIVGREPFQVTLKLENSGELPLDLNISIGADLYEVALAAGESTAIQQTMTIDSDTTVVADITGDVTQSLEKLIQFGESVTLSIAPDEEYGDGAIEIPYTVTNDGALDVRINVNFLLESDGSIIESLTRSYSIPVGESVEDSLVSILSPEQYTLSFSTPFQASSSDFTVLGFNHLTVSASASEMIDGVIPLSVGVVNMGWNDFSGRLEISSDFYKRSIAIAIAAGQQKQYSLSLNPGTAAPGMYTVNVSVEQTGNVVAATTVAVNILAPVFELVSSPEDPVYTLGQHVSEEFGIKNTGNLAGETHVRLQALERLDETQMALLSPGMEANLVFSLTIPEDIEAGQYDYILTIDDAAIQIPFTVQGIDISVDAYLNQDAYQVGDTATLALNIVNNNPATTPDMFARVHYADYDEAQNFSLSNAQVLQFDIPIVEFTGEKIFYGIYMESGRSIHLNSLYLREIGDVITLTTDKQVYSVSDAVIVSVSTDQSSTLSVYAPGYSDELDITGSTSFSFVLPHNLTSGTYSINYQFGEIYGECKFDVLGLSARILECTLDKTIYLPTDEIKAYYRIEMEQAISGALKGWYHDPSGGRVEAFEVNRDFEEGENELEVIIPFNTAYSGIHRLAYGIYDAEPSVYLAGGAEGFDVGQVALLSAATDKTVYGDSERVTLKVGAFAFAEFTGLLSISLDDVPIQSSTVSLTGHRQFTYDLGIQEIGSHIALASLSADGLLGEKEARFMVVDTTAPTLAPEADTTILWPPDHKMNEVIIHANTVDNVGPVTISVEVFSNEPPDTDGDGNTIPDHEITYIDQENGIIYLKLRAERSGMGEGREYTIFITATDPTGNFSVADVVITVPHDME